MSEGQTIEGLGVIPDDWTIHPLGDFVEYVTYGFTNPMPDSDVGPFKLTAKDVAGGRIVYENARRTTWDAYHNLLTNKSRPAKGDVLLTKDGSIGRVAVVDRDDICINQSVAVMRPRLDTDAQFLSYLLQTPHYQNRMAADADGSTIKHIYITRVDKMQIASPTLVEQRAIAAILASLDEKIEHNRRTGSHLEGLARSVFKAWFVDFEPVKAKSAGATSFPGMAAKTFAALPTHFRNSILGPVPEGWKVQAASEVIERLGVGKKFNQKTVKPLGRVPVLDQSMSGFIGYHDEVPGVEASAENPVATFANHTCNMRLLHYSFSTIQNVLPFVGQGVDTVWVYFGLLGRQKFIEYKGHWPDFVLLPLVVPTETVATAFVETVRPLINFKWFIEYESARLAAVRDYLLPRLLSGRVRVRDFEVKSGDKS